MIPEKVKKVVPATWEIPMTWGYNTGTTPV
jgi:hypothetical protein